MSYAMLHENTKRNRENDEKRMRKALDEYDSRVEKTVIYQGREVFVNHIRIDTIYKRTNETKYGYALETDYYKVVVSFSEIENNPKGYVTLTIKDERDLLSFKEDYKEEKLNLDKYELDETMCSIKNILEEEDEKEHEQ